MPRTLLVLILALLAGCRLPGTRPAAEKTPTPEAWHLAWADEFDGSRIDTTAWTSEVMPDPFNEELQYYPGRIDGAPGSNAWLEDSMLVIEAREETYEHRRYTSARLITKGKKAFLYGRFEARMKLPAEVGMWPAFWLLGSTIDTVGWPACGEIDIMEGKGRLPAWTSGALHRGPDPANNRITAADYTVPDGNLHDTWHRYAVEWEAEQIRWYLDDVLFHTIDKPDGEDPAYWPFDHGHGFFLLLNLAVGGWFDKPHLPPANMTPQRLLVDYVRVYRRAG